MSESMNNGSGNTRSLSQLYRRFAGDATTVSVPNADDLLQLARVAHAEEAAAPLFADLLRFSRELEAPSAQLSADVSMAFEQHAPAVHRHAASRRAAAVGSRRWRGVAAIAASLMAVIGVWTLQHAPAPQPVTPVAANAQVPDRIFAALDGRAVASAAPRDEIFRDHFSSDVIFRSHDG